MSHQTPESAAFQSIRASLEARDATPPDPLVDAWFIDQVRYAIAEVDRRWARHEAWRSQPR